jgi:hypothetical protein
LDTFNQFEPCVIGVMVVDDHRVRSNTLYGADIRHSDATPRAGIQIALWRDDFNHRRGLPPQEKDAMLLYPELRTNWEVLKKVAAGEADLSILPRRPGAPPPPIPPTTLAYTRVGDQGKP